MVIPRAVPSRRAPAGLQGRASCESRPAEDIVTPPARSPLATWLQPTYGRLTASASPAGREHGERAASDGCCARRALRSHPLVLGEGVRQQVDTAVNDGGDMLSVAARAVERRDNIAASEPQCDMLPIGSSHFDEISLGYVTLRESRP